MIHKAMELRKAKMEEKQNLIIEMRPEFKAALDQCINFSSILAYT